MVHPTVVHLLQRLVKGRASGTATHKQPRTAITQTPSHVAVQIGSYGVCSSVHMASSKIKHFVNAAPMFSCDRISVVNTIKYALGVSKQILTVKYVLIMRLSLATNPQNAQIKQTSKCALNMCEICKICAKYASPYFPL